MPKLSHLSPPLLWQFFSKICAIPHPSHHEEALSQYIVDWAQKQHLWFERDQAGNILIRKPASHGLENLTPVILQAHLDMVPQKNNDTQHDFNQDPIQPYIDGEWVKAKGTTLGADNGIGLASILAVLADHSVAHGPLEALFTVSEETGMEGAFALKANWLQGKILINTDSEEEGEIYTGCAGGVDASFSLPLTRLANVPASDQLVEINIKGLKGGHSGVDIHLGRGNANKLAARFLASYADKLSLKLITLQGGSLRNAIPREAVVKVAVSNEQMKALEQAVIEYESILRNEMAQSDPGIVINLKSTENSLPPLEQHVQQQLIHLLNIMPNGVVTMSNAVPGVVETSLNVAIVNVEEQQASVHCLIRSLIDSGKQYVINMLTSAASLVGAKLDVSGEYPSWSPDMNSAILQIAIQSYEHLFDAVPQVKVIHAGLECGLFRLYYPKLDMVSIGPTICNPHSPDERVNIVSVNRYWLLLATLLKSLPETR